MTYKYKSLEEIRRMIDRLEGFTENQLALIKSIAETSFECIDRYDE